jgi:hypothetical protein
MVNAMGGEATHRSSRMSGSAQLHREDLASILEFLVASDNCHRSVSEPSEQRQLSGGPNKGGARSEF